ncbi:hypothetical protein BIFADO_02344 [Bifidobacterium adolescentis L2-32]|uniref:Uncharacterized protein n=1 Tax=Bifidobacterium adolescentis L2-32 TaxID=411481 RepID=A7A901_BIFAD|nr:hypothetical protein BIFADO_02344 [Bifidobacterium adolescentis L2-32]
MGFQSTLSVRRATIARYDGQPDRQFQSTLSVRRATKRLRLVSPQSEFQSTLSVRRATTAAKRTAKRIEISIHALRKESDLTADVSPFPLLY